VLAILSYHKIGPPSPRAWETWYHVPESTCAEHLDLLAEDGWRILDTAGALAALAKPATERSALITFDDGYRTLLERTAPRLARRGLPAVAFIPTGFVGGASEWDAGTLEPPEALCSWDDLRELQELGVSIQSHGAGHRHLVGLAPAELEQELAGSKARLEEELGRPVELFSFPYGEAGSGAVRAALAQAGHRAAFTYGGAVLHAAVDDRYAVPRPAIGADTHLAAALTEAHPPGAS
jgi:peptidoglycan/xylan/chitin deacetylase (PgdA/CDA1 family)